MPGTEYEESLRDLQDDVLYMSELVMERIRKGLNALERKDRELAREIIDSDDEINQLYLDIEGDCIDLLRLHEPIAGDFRLVAASYKIITDLERIADLAVNLGEYTLDADKDIFPEVDVQEIGDLALSMIEDAMTAYDGESLDACYAVAEQDDELDELCERASTLVVRDLIETELEANSDEEVEQLLQDVSRLLLTVRDLERVGDHAVNIAARTLYMIENDDELIY